MVSLKFTVTHKCHDKTLNSFRNALLFGAKFLIICLISAAKFLPRGKTFFLETKFLTKAKLPFSWQTFESKANLSFWWQNFFTAAKRFIQSVYNLGGGGGEALGEDNRAAGSDSFIDPIFPGLCPF